MYPKNATVVFDFSDFKSGKEMIKVALPILLIASIGLIFIFQYEFLKPYHNVIFTLYFLLVCVYVGLSRYSIGSINPNEILFSYNSKAEYEGALIHLVKQICNFEHMKPSVKQMMLADYLVLVWSNESSRRHLSCFDQKERDMILTVIILELDLCRERIAELQKEREVPDSIYPTEELTNRMKALLSMKHHLENSTGGITIDS